MYARVYSKLNCVGGSLLSIVAITASSLAGPPTNHAAPAFIDSQTHLVQLQAMTVSAFANSSTEQAGSQPPLATPPSASATEDAGNLLGSVLTTVARTVINAAGVFLAPLWYLAFPITYNVITLDYVEKYLPRTYAVTVIFLWLTFPLNFSNLIFGPPAVTPAASQARDASQNASDVPPVASTAPSAASPGELGEYPTEAAQHFTITAGETLQQQSQTAIKTDSGQNPILAEDQVPNGDADTAPGSALDDSSDAQPPSQDPARISPKAEASRANTRLDHTGGKAASRRANR